MADHDSFSRFLERFTKVTNIIASLAIVAIDTENLENALCTETICSETDLERISIFAGILRIAAALFGLHQAYVWGQRNAPTAITLDRPVNEDVVSQTDENPESNPATSEEVQQEDILLKKENISQLEEKSDAQAAKEELAAMIKEAKQLEEDQDEIHWSVMEAYRLDSEAHHAYMVGKIDNAIYQKEKNKTRATILECDRKRQRLARLKLDIKKMKRDGVSSGWGLGLF
jgi:hypothetical protein